MASFNFTVWSAKIIHTGNPRDINVISTVLLRLPFTLLRAYRLASPVLEIAGLTSSANSQKNDGESTARRDTTYIV